MSTEQSASACFRALGPLVARSEKKRFFVLLCVSFIMALGELAITGLVALMAAVFGSPEAVLRSEAMGRLLEFSFLHFLRDPRYLALACLCAVLALMGGKALLAVFQQWQISTLSDQVGNDAKAHFFRFYLRAPYLWVQNTGTSDMLFAFAASEMLAATLVYALHVLSNGLMVLTIFAGLMAVTPVPSLMFLLAMGLGGGLIVRLIKKTLNAKASVSYAADYQAHRIQQMAVHGLKEMRLYGREATLFANYSESLRQRLAARVRQLVVARLPAISLELMAFGTLVLVLCFLIFVQEAGMARISGIMGFLAAAAWRTLPVGNKLMDGLSALRGHMPYVRKVADLLAVERALQAELLPDIGQPKPSLEFDREIRLDDVSFNYPESGRSAVHNVSFRIKPGEMVGIVGLSGAGKSTLVNILTGLIPPSSGLVSVDGETIGRENAAAWLRHIGYVAQSPYILDASLAENIALSGWGEEIDRQRVQECCRMAALDFLDDLADGLDSVLGERGMRLSGGQAQRVAIARALYSNPDLIIFDEATSALDMKNEKAIHETIISLRSQVTMVIIAHRLTTVEGCDKIIWMDAGVIRKTGKTDEILPEYTAALKAEKKTEA